MVDPSLYSLGRPKSCYHMPSLVVTETWCFECWAGRIHNMSIVLYAPVPKGAEEWLCVEHSHEFFSDIRGRDGASNACFYSSMSPFHRLAVDFLKCAFILAHAVKVVHSKCSDKHEPSLTLRVAVNKS